MEKEILREKLKEIVLKLAKDVETAREKESLLKKVIEEIFPFETYRVLRPDVVEVHGNDTKSLINHFFSTALDETSFKNKAELITKSDTGIVNSVLYARDVWPSKQFSGQNSTDQKRHILLKVPGTSESIEANIAHSRARDNTIIHLKSNSLFTWIPKINCSSIRYSIAADNGAISDINDISWIHQNNHAFTATTKDMLTVNKSFVILRNPFKRLVSFFIDKICHSTCNDSDLSYENAKNVFETNENTTFKEFVDTIHAHPSLIEKDLHTTRQCDFLVYKNYSYYYALERFEEAKRSILENTGLNLVDVRDKNSIKTTKGKEICNDIDHNTPADQIRNYLVNGKAPLARKMYTPDLIAKVASIYLSDILLYADKAPNAYEELNEWMQTLSGVKCI